MTSTSHVTRLVSFEEPSEVQVALAREKCLTDWLWAKKVALIESSHPDWQDVREPWEGARLAAREILRGAHHDKATRM